MTCEVGSCPKDATIEYETVSEKHGRTSIALCDAHGDQLDEYYGLLRVSFSSRRLDPEPEPPSDFEVDEQNDDGNRARDAAKDNPKPRRP